MPPPPSPTPEVTRAAERIQLKLNEGYARLLNLNAQPFPRIDGSTSTEPLQAEIICEVYDLSCPWLQSGDYPAERAFLWHNMTNMDNTFYQMLDSSSIPFAKHHTTHDAYLNLINGQANLLLEARLPSADELRAAEEKNVKLETSAIALDAFIVLAHADNPVNSLTLQQLRDIYSGKITNWSRVGGSDLSITPYQREENSGSQELMKSLVMQDLPMMNAPDLIVYSMAGPFNAINDDSKLSPLGDPAKKWPHGDVSGIASSVYYYERNIAPRYENVKVLSVNGIRPTQANIAEGTYPLVAKVYAVIREGTPPDSPALRMRDWLISNREDLRNGQRVVELSGYIPYIER